MTSSFRSNPAPTSRPTMPSPRGFALILSAVARNASIPDKACCWIYALRASNEEWAHSFSALWHASQQVTQPSSAAGMRSNFVVEKIEYDHSRSSLQYWQIPASRSNTSRKLSSLGIATTNFPSNYRNKDVINSII